MIALINVVHTNLEELFKLLRELNDRVTLLLPMGVDSRLVWNAHNLDENQQNTVEVRVSVCSPNRVALPTFGVYSASKATLASNVMLIEDEGATFYCEYSLTSNFPRGWAPISLATHSRAPIKTVAAEIFEMLKTEERTVGTTKS